MGILSFGLVVFLTSFRFADQLLLDTTTQKYVLIGSIIVMVHLVLMVHELGHLLTGLIQGFRFELFVVGLLGVRREAEKINFYLNKNLAYYGGVGATSPTDDSPDNPQKFARILLAGPIASIVFALVCLVIGNYIAEPWCIFWYTGGITSMAIFFATTIPSKTGVFFTDRKRYQRLVTPGKDQDIELAMLNIMGKFAKDNSYANIQPSDIELMIGDEDSFINFFAWFNMICWQLEHKGTIEASTQEAYHFASQKVSKNLVTAFDKEIEKYAQGLKQSSPTV